jgi:hypothetical protein
VFLQVNKDVEAGAKAVYDTKSTTGGVSLEVGAKTYLVRHALPLSAFCFAWPGCAYPRTSCPPATQDNAAFVKAKVNNSGIVALGYTQALRPGVKVGFGLALDTQRLNDGESFPQPAPAVKGDYRLLSDPSLFVVSHRRLLRPQGRRLVHFQLLNNPRKHEVLSLVISTFPFCFSLLRSAVVPLLFFSAIFLPERRGSLNEGMKGKGERRVSDRGLDERGRDGIALIIHFFCTTKSVNSGREQRGWGRENR